MHIKCPVDAPATLRSVVGGATWGLRNGFDVAPRGARAPHARPRARPFPVTARFGHPLLENRFPQHLFGTLSLGELGQQLPIKLPALRSILVRFLDKSKIWLELRVGVASAYHSSAQMDSGQGQGGTSGTVPAYHVYRRRPGGGTRSIYSYCIGGGAVRDYK